jgi:hypothetical protein
MSDFGMTLEEMDVTAFLNMRAWLRKALEDAGARQIGAGVGLGQADIDIELEGFRYNVSIKPLPKRAPMTTHASAAPAEEK